MSRSSVEKHKPSKKEQMDMENSNDDDFLDLLFDESCQNILQFGEDDNAGIVDPLVKPETIDAIPSHTSARLKRSSGVAMKKIENNDMNEYIESCLRRDNIDPDSKEGKQMKRKLRNRVSAQNHRIMKNEQMKRLEEENLALKEDRDRLVRENEQLRCLLQAHNICIPLSLHCSVSSPPLEEIASIHSTDAEDSDSNSSSGSLEEKFTRNVRTRTMYGILMMFGFLSYFNAFSNGFNGISYSMPSLSSSMVSGGEALPPVPVWFDLTTTYLPDTKIGDNSGIVSSPSYLDNLNEMDSKWDKHPVPYSPAVTIHSSQNPVVTASSSAVKTNLRHRNSLEKEDFPFNSIVKSSDLRSGNCPRVLLFPNSFSILNEVHAQHLSKNFSYSSGNASMAIIPSYLWAEHLNGGTFESKTLFVRVSSHEMEMGNSWNQSTSYHSMWMHNHLSNNDSTLIEVVRPVFEFRCEITSVRIM